MQWWLLKMVDWHQLLNTMILYGVPGVTAHALLVGVRDSCPPSWHAPCFLLHHHGCCCSVDGLQRLNSDDAVPAHNLGMQVRTGLVCRHCGRCVCFCTPKWVHLSPCTHTSFLAHPLPHLSNTPLTTMPMSTLFFTSTVPSSTRFMN